MEYTVSELLKEVNSSYKHPGDERIRAIAEHLIEQLYFTIEKFDVSHDEVWAFQKWLNELGASGQFGLLGAGIGIERLLDILADEKDQKLKLTDHTPRAIEGPLYVPNAPLEKAFARIDDGTEKGEVLIMEGDIIGSDGNKIPGAIVDLWMANQRGAYSFVDPTQTPYNNRRKIETDSNGHYVFRGLVPPGYSVPEGSPTDKALKLLGREGNRPAHIHFIISREGYTPLTTQVNMPGDRYLNEDFAFATRDELVVTLKKVTDQNEIAKFGLSDPFTHVSFNFVLQKK
jgi:catechol 1,2-dioxygenase